jgi:penicillin-binding protein 2
MAANESDLADRSGRLMEEHRGYDPRIVFFYFLVASLLLLLGGGLAYRQLFRSGLYQERERQQNQRRLLEPGPRGNIYDRNGQVLVGNRPRFAVMLDLDGLQQEFRRAFIQIRKNYREDGDRDLPSSSQMEQIARVSVVQQYLDQVNVILGRHDQVDVPTLRRHFDRQLLLPYLLIADLSQDDFARLTEHLPVRSPLQIYATSTRAYPNGSVAAHVLGYVGVDEDVDAEDFPGEDLTTFKMKGSVGRDGLEKRFDGQLQGEAGGSIFRVDPAGFKVNPPLETRMPLQGKSLTTSLDIDLQKVAEAGLGDRMGAAVALDVRTGEVLVMASKPDYDLNNFSPRLAQQTVVDIEKRQAWTNLAVAGLFAPGSTFKTVVAIAGLRAGISPTTFTVDCEGAMKIGNRIFRCDLGRGHHGVIALSEAIAESCDIYFWTLGQQVGVEAIADEARELHLDRPTGIELPNETHGMTIPDPAWKERKKNEKWFPGDTANMSIGQGNVLVTPLQMACLAASLARNEVSTQPTLLHDPNRAAQHSAPLGLTPEQRAALLAGMEACTNTTYPEDTAYALSTVAILKIPGVRIAGKTGTAQVTGKGDVSWFICFAPIENPEIAVAVTMQSETVGESFAGGLHAAPVADLIMKKYFEKKAGVSGQNLTVAPAPRPESPTSAQIAGSPSPGSISPSP